MIRRAAGVAVVVFLGWTTTAWADSPNPQPPTQGSVVVNADGSRTVTVWGNWIWAGKKGIPAKNGTCAPPPGVALDWNDSTQPGNTLDGGTVGVKTANSLNPADNAIHLAHCGTFNQKANTTTGTWGNPVGGSPAPEAWQSHTYPSSDTGPISVCPVTYHVKGNPPLAGGPGHDPDNSVEENHLSITTDCFTFVAQPPLYAGYVDTRNRTHKSSGSFGIPSPWNGGSGVTFVGLVPGQGNTEKYYDSGALRFVNPSSTSSMTVSNVSVTINVGSTSCLYNPWPNLNATIPAGGQLILTETGRPAQCGNDESNFDTSDSYFNSTEFGQTPACQPDSAIPEIDGTINGTAVVYHDTNQVLNTAGVDLTECRNDGTDYGEFHNWSLVSG